MQRAQERISEVSSVVHESIDGALIVKTLGREDAETARLAERADALRRERVTAGFLRAGIRAGAAGPAVASGSSCCWRWGSWRVSTGAVTAGHARAVRLAVLPAVVADAVHRVDPGRAPARAGGQATGSTRCWPSRSRWRRRGSPCTCRSVPLGVEAQARHLPPGRGSRSCAASTSTSAPTNRWRSWASPERARACWHSSWFGWTTRTSGEVLIGGVNARHVDPGELRAAATLVFQESFLFAASVGDNIALDSGASHDEVRRAASARTRGCVHPGDPARIRHRGRRARSDAERRASASAWRWRGRWSAARGSSSWTTPPARWIPRSRPRSSTVCGPSSRRR